MKFFNVIHIAWKWVKGKFGTKIYYTIKQALLSYTQNLNKHIKKNFPLYINQVSSK